MAKFIILAVLFLLTVTLYVKDELVIHNQQRQISDLSAKHNNFDLQLRCAAQAEKTFDLMDYKNNKDPKRSIFFQNHYNNDIGKCFMTIDDITYLEIMTITHKFLFDAVEQRPFATFIQNTKTDKPNWCEVITKSNKKVICASEDEYSKYVSEYMEYPSHLKL